MNEISLSTPPKDLVENPNSFRRLRGVKVRYCQYIKSALARSALENGTADQRSYERTKKRYAYRHRVEAFLKVRDNLYLADARQVLNNFRADLVPQPPYNYDYEQPSLALLDRIPRLAGNTSNDSEAALSIKARSRKKTSQ
ncbi:hypothetical protein [Erwinia aphidicola]|uniref:hypothetical protein n=1 Tax=Erwinia aphidicola TaxID=68334 RepID=UPI0030D5A921